MPERRSARRILHYGKEQMLWECRVPKAEGTPGVEETVFEAKEMGKILTSMKPLSGIDTILTWYGAVEECTYRNPTKGTHKLPAVSGLMREAHRQLKPQYLGSRCLGGLWLDKLHIGLSWETLTRLPNCRPTRYPTPPWSWASIDGTMPYAHSAREWKTNDRSATFDIDVFEAETNTVAVDGFGQVEDGNEES